MLEFGEINIDKDIQTLYAAYNCLDEIVHAMRTNEYPEYFEDDCCNIFEKYGIDWTRKEVAT